MKLDADHEYVGSFWPAQPVRAARRARRRLLHLPHARRRVPRAEDGRRRPGAGAARRRPVAVVRSSSPARGPCGRRSPTGAAWTWAAVVVAAGALVGLVVAASAAEGWAFVASAVAIVAAVVLIFGSLYPDVMPRLRPGELASRSPTRRRPLHAKVMTWVAGVLTPLVLLYQGWTYWVFRKRISTHAHPGRHGPDVRQACPPLERAVLVRREAARPASAPVRPSRPRLRRRCGRARPAHGGAGRRAGAPARARPGRRGDRRRRRWPSWGRRSRGSPSSSPRGRWSTAVQERFAHRAATARRRRAAGAGGRARRRAGSAVAGAGEGPRWSRWPRGGSTRSSLLRPVPAAAGARGDRHAAASCSSSSG